ncbi:hypothetical protein NOSIN_18775 [Nocardiopsis sinuspersici]|uniref:Uncharacterized protein n=1 Tax=Nocardiopsis sinuspersici TaxID=501010 RepID=A0A1V3C4F7_9ACTN|nr:hypothetical protein NOSIN_18775 [Nocardiopsis sinuspersici]
MAHQLGHEDHAHRLGRQLAAPAHEIGTEDVAKHVRPERLAAIRGADPGRRADFVHDGVRCLGERGAVVAVAHQRFG